MDNVDLLMNFGLTRQEASVYVLLFSEGELNGYEVAKLSGISRSNAYCALATLVDKGAAYVFEETAVKYSPVPIEEFCRNKIRFLEKVSKELAFSMPVRRVESEGYITIRGDQHIFDKLLNMVQNTKERLYLSMSLDRLALIKDDLNLLVLRGIKLVIITSFPFELEGAIVYYSENRSDQIRLICDSKFVLTGGASDGGSPTCLFSCNNNLVEVFKDALSNEIKLIELIHNNP